VKTIGCIAFEAFYGQRSSESWDDAREYDRERWERSAKAVAIAVEGAERKTSKCEGVPPAPRGTAPNFGQHLTCLVAPDPLYPGFLAAVRQ
jgi:hypothetical protein